MNSVNLTASVSIVNDGTIYDQTPDPHNHHNLTLITQEEGRVAVEFDLDLGIAGQSVTLSTQLAGLTRAILTLAPIAELQPGERVWDTEYRHEVIVREISGDTALVDEGRGLVRRPVGVLVRHLPTMAES